MMLINLQNFGDFFLLEFENGVHSQNFGDAFLKFDTLVVLLLVKRDKVRVTYVWFLQAYNAQKL